MFKFFKIVVNGFGNMIGSTDNENNTVRKESVRKFSKQVLDDFRMNVGKYPAETGGMLASTGDENFIDKCYFDIHSKNTSGTFYYDVESMSEVFREWKAKGYTTNGIYHSHPTGCIRPSYHDISSALLHINFFKLEYFYLPIIQSDRRGFYSLYFYVVTKKGGTLNVELEYVVNATSEGYAYGKHTPWSKKYAISELEGYRKSVDCRNRPTHESEVRESKAEVNRATANLCDNTDRYFKKVSSLYPEKVLDKVIVCVGTGGARSALENFARCGFRNFVLIDADTISESNIATQGVFISEMGKKKVDVIKARILDINPRANVVCVDRFLDDNMSDEEFKGYMDLFPGKAPKDYLILGCTDNFEAQKRSSLLALKYGTPYLAAMMYKAGAAAELVFVYPGVTESCPRCMLGSRFEKYEQGFENDVDSSECSIFATERMNALKGYIATMLLMYHEDPSSPFSEMLDGVKNRNFVQIRLDPKLKDKLGIDIFDVAYENASQFSYMDETVWIPQKPDHPSNGYDECKLCGGTGHLEDLYMKWSDTRKVRMNGSDKECEKNA